MRVEKCVTRKDGGGGGECMRELRRGLGEGVRV